MTRMTIGTSIPELRESDPRDIRKVKTLIVKGEHMQTGHELFVHGLNDMMDAERQLVDALQENANDSSRAELKKAFDQHRRETEGQIERLRQSFELLGEEPEDTECHGIRGLIAEKKAFTEEDPSEDLIDVLGIHHIRCHHRERRFWWVRKAVSFPFFLLSA